MFFQTKFWPRQGFRTVGFVWACCIYVVCVLIFAKSYSRCCVLNDPSISIGECEIFNICNYIICCTLEDVRICRRKLCKYPKNKTHFNCDFRQWFSHQEKSTLIKMKQIIARCFYSHWLVCYHYYIEFFKCNFFYT